MTGKCPICNSDLSPNSGQYPPITGTKDYFDCPRCGRYSLSTSSMIELPFKLQQDENKIATLSYSINKIQRNNYWAYIDSYLIDEILQNSPPTLNDQINSFIWWLGQVTAPGKEEWVKSSTHLSIMGATSSEGFALVMKRLVSVGLIENEMETDITGTIQGPAILTFDGWDYFDKLNRGAINSRKAFMAMKFGEPELDEMLNQYFKPAVAATGFELYKLDEAPRAGLIDDRLRVEIRTSRFLVSDLTHENAGAYWEAGYAEGLGKPVIYTCEKSKFEKQKTHFDTNHHLTVVWDKEKPELAVEQLKAIIRATLPDEARLTDP